MLFAGNQAAPLFSALCQAIGASFPSRVVSNPLEWHFLAARGVLLQQNGQGDFEFGWTHCYWWRGLCVFPSNRILFWSLSHYLRYQADWLAFQETFQRYEFKIERNVHGKEGTFCLSEIGAVMLSQLGGPASSAIFDDLSMGSFGLANHGSIKSRQAWIDIVGPISLPPEGMYRNHGMLSVYRSEKFVDLDPAATAAASEVVTSKGEYKKVNRDPPLEKRITVWTLYVPTSVQTEVDDRLTELSTRVKAARSDCLLRTYVNVVWKTEPSIQRTFCPITPTLWIERHDMDWLVTNDPTPRFLSMRSPVCFVNRP